MILTCPICGSIKIDKTMGWVDSTYTAIWRRCQNCFHQWQEKMVNKEKVAHEEVTEEQATHH